MRPAGDTAATVVVVAEDGTEVTLGRVSAARPDLALVDALLWTQLAARRQGWRVRLGEVSPDLRGLLELAGLGAVVGLQPQREPELGEQLGEDEVVQGGDAAV